MQTDLHISITHSKPIAQLPDIVASRAWSIDGVYFAEPRALTPAALSVLDERKRQMDQLGWSPEHDDEHSAGDLACAAAAYAINAGCQRVPAMRRLADALWPWTPSDWKPKTPRQDLVRAAALILAEIERLDRAGVDITPAPEPTLFDPAP